MTGAGVVRMPMGDDRTINPTTHGVDVEIAGRAIEALWRRAEKVFGADHPGQYVVAAAFRQIVGLDVLQFATLRV